MGRGASQGNTRVRDRAVEKRLEGEERWVLFRL